MNAPIRRLFGLVVLLMLALIFETSWNTVFKADSLRHNPKNQRAALEQQRIPRGRIRAADEQLLAHSVKTKDGTYTRRYPPLAKLFSQEVGYSFPGSTGRTGLEASYDDELSGRDNGLSSILDELRGKKVKGDDLITTLDPAAQKLAHDRLAGRQGAVVAMVPSTGAVKVMAQTTGYDPNDAGDTKAFAALLSDAKDAPLENVNTQGRFPPGSTFKAVTAIAALDSGKFKPSSTLSGKSPITVSGTSLANDNNDQYGQIDMSKALTYSVNTYWAQVAEKIGKPTMKKYMERLGFDQRSPLDLPKDQRAASGVLTPTGAIRNPESSYVDIGRVGIGQEALGVTPLQMLQVYAAIANGGVMMKPHLGAKIIDDEGRTVRDDRTGGDREGDVDPDGLRGARHDAPCGRGGNGPGRRDRRHRCRGQDRHGPAGRARLHGPLVHRLRARRAPEDRRRRDARARQGRLRRRRRGADRQAGHPGAAQMRGLAPGTIVDGRYQIVALLGSGGMADVYAADDQQLGRRVALKILYGRFAEDAEFVERFRREASHAAALQHQNVVAVYDRGEWDGTSYIAMEYVDGRTLKQIVSAEGPLEPLRAIDLTQQILRAARFAHRRGVIHRDLKPHNVIIDEEDRAKVTDFGIARAGASDMTQTGSIMGTAQYLSPEQAQGHPVSAQSDLYSIGIVLYEMLTGQVPFTGDSPVTIALKQVNEPPVPPSQLVHGIAPQLEAVVLKALAKSPADRYVDADAFIAALEEAKQAIETGVAGVVAQDTAAFAAVARPYTPPPVPSRPFTEELWAESLPPGPLPPGPPRDRRRRWPAVVLALVVLIAAAAVAVVLLTADKKVSVPGVVGHSSDDAAQILHADKLEVSSTSKQSSRPINIVLSQVPAAGTSAKEGDTVQIVVSAGLGSVQVPYVDDHLLADALAQIKKNGFKPVVGYRSSSTVDKGRVISTQPANGLTSTAGFQVKVYVSSGPKIVPLPDVVNQDVNDAEATLSAQKFTYTEVPKESDQPVGTVLKQEPAYPSKQPQGTQVTLTIAKQSSKVAIPPVTGMTANAAGAALGNAGNFIPNVRKTCQPVDDPTQDQIVQQQSPASGEKRTRGATVNLILGCYTAPVDTTPTPPPASGTPRAVRVAVLRGGRSSEHEVSLQSGEAVAAGLASGGHDVVVVEIDRDGAWRADGDDVTLHPGAGLLGADVAFPVLHGPYGEDGAVQGVLEVLDVPYVGSGVTASAVCIDKLLLKDLMAQHGVPQVAYAHATPETEPDVVGFPCWVKPARLGSSVGIVRVDAADEFAPAVEQALAYDPRVIVEAHAAGLEVECSVLGAVGDAQASEPGEIVLLTDSGLVRLRRQVHRGRHGSRDPGADLGHRPRAGQGARARGLRDRGMQRAGARRLLRRRRGRPAQRAQHDARPDGHERLRQALGGQRDRLPRPARAPVPDRHRAPRRRARLLAARLRLAGLLEQLDLGELDLLAAGRQLRDPDEVVAVRLAVRAQRHRLVVRCPVDRRRLHPARGRERGRHRRAVGDVHSAAPPRRGRDDLQLDAVGAGCRVDVDTNARLDAARAQRCVVVLGRPVRAGLLSTTALSPASFSWWSPSGSYVFAA